jgi:hypothetical protein
VDPFGLCADSDNQGMNLASDMVPQGQDTVDGYVNATNPMASPEDGPGGQALQGIAMNLAGSGMMVIGGVTGDPDAVDDGAQLLDSDVPLETTGAPGSGVPAASLDSLPGNVQNMYNQYDSNGWNGNVSGQTPGTKAGGSYQNSNGALPTADVADNPITYR